MKSFVEMLEDYKVGLEEHLCGKSAERETHTSSESEDVLMQEYKLPKEELLEISDEIGRVGLFINVFNKFLDEPSN